MDLLYRDDEAGFNVLFCEHPLDFFINEIDADGFVLHLASKEIEKPEATAVFSAEQLEEISQMMGSEVATTVLIDVSGMTKQKRLSMHTTLLDRYQDTVKSTTCTIDGTSTMKIEKSITPAAN